MLLGNNMYFYTVSFVIIGVVHAEWAIGVQRMRRMTEKGKSDKYPQEKKNTEEKRSEMKKRCQSS